jgi:hypothetical protein
MTNDNHTRAIPEPVTMTADTSSASAAATALPHFPAFDVLSVMPLPPLLAPLLREAFTVHDRLHLLDPAAF